jgi:hypothetical protein
MRWTNEGRSERAASLWAHRSGAEGPGSHARVLGPLGLRCCVRGCQMMVMAVASGGSSAAVGLTTAFGVQQLVLW